MSPRPTLPDSIGPHLRRWRSRLRLGLLPRSAFPYLVIGAVLIPLGLFAISAYFARATIEADAAARVELVRDALAEHAGRLFATHRLVADDVGTRIQGMTWEEIARSRELADLLRRIVTDFPEIHAVWLVDSEGSLRAGSPEIAPPRNLSNRVRHLHEQGAEVAVVGPRHEGSTLAEDFFTLAFRRQQPDGSSPGLIGLAISPAYFRALHQRLGRGRDLLTIVHQNGEVLAHYPADGEIPKALPAASPLRNSIGRAEHNLPTGTSGIDGVPRLFAFARVTDWPIYVGYGVRRSEIDDLWWRRVTLNAAYALPAGLALLLLAGLAWRRHDELEDAVRRRTHALSEALAEREALLKEVHHRVRNNMQVISSLIRIQDRTGSSPDETIRRVHAMSLVHDLAYTQGTFAQIDLATYIRNICDAMRQSGPRQATFDLALAPLTLSLERAIPFALILSEVLTNALRHAAPEPDAIIRISLSEHDGIGRLTVTDEGTAPNPEMDGKGVGIGFLKGLAAQLGGTISYERTGKAIFTMTFPASDADAAPLGA